MLVHVGDGGGVRWLVCRDCYLPQRTYSLPRSSRYIHTCLWAPGQTLFDTLSSMSSSAMLAVNMTPSLTFGAMPPTPCPLYSTARTATPPRLNTRGPTSKRCNRTLY